MKQDLSVIVPVYNAAKTVTKLYYGLTQALEGTGCCYEIIMVDDGSTDDSYDLIKRISQDDIRLKPIKLAGNFGQQNAILCGLQLAEGQVLITIDDDLQHPPREIKKLLKKIDAGHDLVFGLPSEKKHPFYRNVGTKIIDCFFNIMKLKPHHLKISSFRAVKREVIRPNISSVEGFVYISALFLKGAKNPANVFFTHEERKYGRSNYNLLKLGALLGRMILAYGILPQRDKHCAKPNFIIAEKIL